MDAFGIIYPQYWQDKDCDTNFDRHLKILKAHYGYPCPFRTVQNPDGMSDPVLLFAYLDMQASLFRLIMKENAHSMMKKPLISTL
jgi:hypothetical protein